MPELSAPLRLTWDLPADPEAAATLWRQVVAGGVLFLEIRVAPDTLSALGGLDPVLTAGSAPRLSLLGNAETLLAVSAALGPQGCAATRLLLPPFAPPRFPEQLAAEVPDLIPALWSDPEGMRSFAAALQFARRCGLRTVALLNPPAPCTPLTATDRAAAAGAWNEFGSPEIALQVHDLFLAEALGLEPFRDYHGCQAGSFLAHLDRAGRLLACRTLPVVLGDLLQEDLRTAWAGPARRSLLAGLAAVPMECAACGLAPSCAGGCRGLADDLGRDTSCPGVRRDGTGAP